MKDKEIRELIRDLIRSEISNQNEQSITYGPDNLGHTVRMWKSKSPAERLKTFSKDSQDAARKADDKEEDEEEDEEKKNEEFVDLLKKDTKISLTTGDLPIDPFVLFVKDKGKYNFEDTKKVDELVDKLANKFKNHPVKRKDLENKEMAEFGLVNLVKK